MRRFSPAWSPEEKCSTPIPEVTRQVIVSRLPFFTGEVLPRYAGDLDDGTVRELLDELATQMGQCLEQVRRALPIKFIHVAQILNGAAE